jgi:nucleoside-diphosphate-sugar epimerase
MNILVTGGAGYLGAVASLQLMEAGHHVRVFDDLLFGSRGTAALAGDSRFRFVKANMLDHGAVSEAVKGVQAVVHLAAVVGDPACARNPELAKRVNVEASQYLIAAARDAGVERFIFASTCSNYGRMSDTSVLATEAHELRPVSLYAETKVQVEQHLLGGKAGSLSPTVLRFATLYGVAPRMRFDLTVNEFVLRLMRERRLTVFGEQFWRPYVHVRDAARAIVCVLGQPLPAVTGRVFNVGSTDENYTKTHLVELIRQRIGPAAVDFVHKAEDPRDYRVSFERIRSELEFMPFRRVSDGIDEIAYGLETGLLENPEHWTHYNTPAATPVKSDAA